MGKEEMNRLSDVLRLNLFEAFYGDHLFDDGQSGNKDCEDADGEDYPVRTFFFKAVI